ncbi:hypothetical protein ACLE20_00685 [Rhizobium sp. YIM 134829]|uniref:hypothetical protein n=1 Tax=Rhizobium sp. YIM 134829 TaxID=3390453 RepID=UPI00397DC2D3
MSHFHVSPPRPSLPAPFGSRLLAWLGLSTIDPQGPCSLSHEDLQTRLAWLRDPLAHPDLAAMSLRQQADLPPARFVDRP